MVRDSVISVFFICLAVLGVGLIIEVVEDTKTLADLPCRYTTLDYYADCPFEKDANLIGNVVVIMFLGFCIVLFTSLALYFIIR